VLIAFFIVIIFIIPGYFLSKISDNEKDVGGVDVDNRKIFTDLINENMTGKIIPSILAQSLEFSQMKVRNDQELNILKSIKSNDLVKEAIPKPSDKKPSV